MTTIRRTDSSDVNVMGLPSPPSHTESSSPHFRLDTVAAAAGMNSAESAHNSQSGGVTGGRHENKTTALPAQEDHRTAAHNDTPTRPHTVRKKKSSYDLRDEFQHPEFFTTPSPDRIVWSASASAATQELEAATQPPLSHKTRSSRADGDHGKIRRSRTE